ncbi:hypothetical protein NKG05_13185 [Oerskovia sp. M15]
MDLIDPVPSHVAQAAEIPGVRAQVGDARVLPSTTSPRTPCSSSARCTTSPSGRTGCSRCARPHGSPGGRRRRGRRDQPIRGPPGARRGGPGRGRHRAVAAPGARDGAPRPALGFTTAYFHRPEELADELEEADLDAVAVYGVEGPSAPALDNLPWSRPSRCSVLRSGRPACSSRTRR